MIEWGDGDMSIPAAGLHLDAGRPRPTCFVSHAHSDHIGLHGRTIATLATAALCDHRLGCPDGEVVRLPYRQDWQLDADTRLRLVPAGHVYGSAMLHVTRPEGSLLYTGDFRLRDDALTVEPAEPEPADYLVTETTYGLPHFRFPPRRLIQERLVEIVAQAFRDGRQPIVLGYSLGKAQEATRALTDAGFAVTQHGAAFALSQIHDRFGVELGPYRRYAYEDFHGPTALDLRQRGVLVAPTHTARSPFVTRFKDPCRIVLTGWALTKGAIYRYGVDHALPISDHADFDELLELIDRVRPKKVFTTHGYSEFAETLRSRGVASQVVGGGEQLELFA